jgi:lipopolysaccharide/colanic/teichoic acid biosynthesis glycosyltransferase
MSALTVDALLLTARTATTSHRSGEDARWEQAAESVLPRSRFGPLFGTTRGDVRRAAKKLASRSVRPSPLRMVLKRLFDVVGSLLLLVVFAPLLLQAAFAIKRFDGGPVLFLHERIGKGGKTFRAFKFRTMVLDADKMLSEMLREQGSDPSLFTRLKDDPRITPPGRWLRRFSIDELPQIVNVLKGDMSLVGPRAPLTHELALYPDDSPRSLLFRPGFTGLWKVAEYSNLTWAETIRLDLYWTERWSLSQDLAILGRTAATLSAGKRAY